MRGIKVISLVIFLSLVSLFVLQVQAAEETVIKAEQRLLDKLSVLDKAFEFGILTKEEYEEKRAKLEAELASLETQRSEAEQGILDKLAALEETHQSGILTDEEYQMKKSELEKELAELRKDKNLQKSPDNSFTYKLPEGWIPEPVKWRGTAERVIVFDSTASEGDVLNEFVFLIYGQLSEAEAEMRLGRLVRQGMTLIQQQFPFVTSQGEPRYYEIGGIPAAIMIFAGRNPQTNIEIKVWGGVIVKDRFYYSLVAAGVGDIFESTQQKACSLFGSIKPII